jgi:hypothetical protein
LPIAIRAGPALAYFMFEIVHALSMIWTTVKAHPYFSILFIGYIAIMTAILIRDWNRIPTGHQS